MKKIDLTAEELRFLDPSGKAQAWMKALKSHTELKCNPPSSLIRITPAEMFERYKVLMSKLTLDDTYRRFNTSQEKSWGAQGGVGPWSELEQAFLAYYDPVCANDAFIHPLILRGRDFFIKLIRECVDRNGGVQYVETRGVTGTAGGLPTMSKKGTFDAETVEMRRWSHLFPAVPGYRIMRNNLRAVFQDATVNVRRIENILSSCKRWLVAYFPNFFSAWANPWFYRNPLITKALERGFASVEFDYQKMDRRFRRQIALEVVCPIYEIMLPGSSLTLYTYVEEAFQQPLFMGSTLWTGLHTLFSGLGITNDFETIYTICLVLGIMLELEEPYYVAALGDDVTLMLPRNKARQAFELAYDASCQTGLVIHPLGTKSNIHDDHVEFCREFFSVRNRRYGHIIAGYYPSVLTLNNVVQPEKLQSGVAAEVSAMLQRLDGLRHNKEFAPVCDLVRRFNTADLTRPASSLPRDWWERLYGTAWNPESSPSWQYYTDGKPLPFVPPQRL